MDIITIAIFVAGIAAFWLSAICGGGASLILIPLLNMSVPTAQVPFALTVGTFTSSIARLSVFRKFVCKKIVYWFVPCSIPGVWIGAWLIKYINPFYLQFIVACFLIANLPELFKSKKKITEEPAQPNSTTLLAIVGFLAGFVSGMTGAIGLLFNRFYLKYGLSKEQIVATRAANEIILHFIKLIIYISLGVFGELSLYIGLLIALSSVISAMSVKYILPYLPEYLFRKVGYLAMVLSGGLLLSGSLKNIFKTDDISLRRHIAENGLLLNWKGNQVILEYSFKNGFTVERQIHYKDLPPDLQKKYDELLKENEHIFLEKRFRFLKPVDYEFYIYDHHGKLTRLIFQAS